MTAPTINGTRYPQPVEDLLPAARERVAELGEIPSRNRLMKEFRIGVPKANELRDRLVAEAEERAGWTVEQVRDVFGLDQENAEKVLRMMAHKTPLLDGVDPSVDPWDYAEPIGPDPAGAAEQTRVYQLARGGTGGATDDDVTAAARRVAADPDATEYVRTVARDLVDATPDTRVRIDTDHVPGATEPTPAVETDEQVEAVGHPGTTAPATAARQVVVWPIVLLALPAFVAIWGGWVGLGGLTGFGKVNLLPGIGSGWVIDSAITLPIGVETYAAYALYVWLSGRVPGRARRFAKWSALGSLVVGAAGQVAYHLLVADGATKAPWPITMLVACLPVAVLGMGAALAHLVREDSQQ